MPQGPSMDYACIIVRPRLVRGVPDFRTSYICSSMFGSLHRTLNLKFIDCGGPKNNLELFDQVVYHTSNNLTAPSDISKSQPLLR